MLKYDVKLNLDDEEHRIHLQVYQQVEGSEAESPEEVVKRAKQQFRNWAEHQGSEWKFVALRLPFTQVTDCEIQLSQNV